MAEADNISSGDEKAVGLNGHDTAAVTFESQAPQEPTVAEYAATRISTLKPPMHSAPNPFRLIAMLSGKQWLFFAVGFFAWYARLSFP